MIVSDAGAPPAAGEISVVVSDAGAPAPGEISAIVSGAPPAPEGKFR